MRRLRYHAYRGSILMYVLMAVALLSLLLTAFVVVTASSRHQTEAQLAHHQVTTQAEGALSESLWQMERSAAVRAMKENDTRMLPLTIHEPATMLHAQVTCIQPLQYDLKIKAQKDTIRDMKSVRVVLLEEKGATDPYDGSIVMQFDTFQNKRTNARQVLLIDGAIRHRITPSPDVQVLDIRATDITVFEQSADLHMSGTLYLWGDVTVQSTIEAETIIVDGTLTIAASGHMIAEHVVLTTAPSDDTAARIDGSVEQADAPDTEPLWRSHVSHISRTT